MHRLGFLLFLLMAIAVATQATRAQDRLPALKQVEFFKTTRTEFEKMYGAPQREFGVATFRYLIDGAQVDVDYSTGPCTENRPYHVKKDVVLSYTIEFAEPIPLSSLKIDLKQFRKDTSGDLVEVYQYLHKRKGVVLRVFERVHTTNEEVFAIIRGADDAMKEQMRCSETGINGQASNVWRGITPLVSTRTDVETMIGKPESLGRSKYLLLYKTSDGKVFVYYSQGPCAIGAKAGWNVPEYTVVRISFDPTVFPRVDDLKIDRTRFKVHPDPEILNSAFYTNETDGIVLTVDTSDNTVTNFSYFPESKYDHMQCKNIGSESKATKSLEQ